MKQSITTLLPIARGSANECHGLPNVTEAAASVGRSFSKRERRKRKPNACDESVLGAVI